MKASEFSLQELRRTEEIKKDKTLRAMIQTRDERISHLQRQLKWWRCLTAILTGATASLAIVLFG